MTTAKYDKIADWYDEVVSDNKPLHQLILTTVFDLIGDVAGLKVCDVACGQGVVSRRLATQGANVVGVDISTKMLAIATRYEAEEPLGIDYRQEDAADLHTLADSTFDGVVCNQALADIPDLQACLSGASRILRPGGWFVFSITHPCFQGPDSHWITETDGSVRRVIHSYFEERLWYSDYKEGVRGQVGAHHRKLSTYINSLAHARLVLEQVVEPRPVDASDQEPYYGAAIAPTILAARCRRDGGPHERTS